MASPCPQASRPRFESTGGMCPELRRQPQGVSTMSRVQTTSSAFSEESPEPLKNTVEGGSARLARAWPMHNSGCVNQFTTASEGLQDGSYLRRVG